MPTARRVALPLLAVILLGLAWHAARRADPPTPAASPPQAAEADMPDIARPEPAVAASEVSPERAAPLPPQLAALVARAEAGEARAACELGTRLLACTYASFWTPGNIEAMRKAEREAEARGDAAAANEAATNLMAALRSNEACADLPAALRSRAFEFTRQAALAGEPEAIVRYAAGHALADASMQPYTFLRLPRFDTWRAEAPALLAKLEQSGDPQAVLARLEAIGEQNRLALLVPPDPVRDAATLALARRLFGEHEALQKIRMPLEPTQAQAREAQALAEQWHRSHFSGRTFALEEHLAGLRMPWAPEFGSPWPPSSGTRPGCFDSSLGSAP